MQTEWLFTQLFIGDTTIVGRSRKRIFLLILPVLSILNIFLTQIYCCDLLSIFEESLLAHLWYILALLASCNLVRILLLLDLLFNNFTFSPFLSLKD